MSKDIMKYEQYYFNKMTEAERDDFREELKSDKEKLKEYKHFVAIMEALEYDIASDLRKDMEKWEADRSSKEGGGGSRKGRMVIFRNIVAVAAGVLLLIGFISINLIYSDSAILQRYMSEYTESPTRSMAPIKQQDSLYEDDYFMQQESGHLGNLFKQQDSSHKDGDFIGVKASTENKDFMALYFNLYNLYELEKYERVLEEAAVIGKWDMYYGQALVLKAKSHQKLGNEAAAKELYKEALEVFAENDLEIAKETTEYEYLVYLFEIEGDTEEFNTVLQSILSNPDHLFYKTAKDLRNDLRSFWRRLLIF